LRLRKIILIIVGLELLALPAAAYLYSGITLPDTTHVVSADIKSPPGVQRFFVSSDGPFAVTARKLSGQTKIFVSEKGHIGEVAYGGNTQLPGPDQGCVLSGSPDRQIIYTANQAIITRDGDAVSQAILVSVVHDKDISPVIEFMSASKAAHKNIPKAQACRL